MSDIGSLAQYAQIASTIAQLGSTAYSLANQPAGGQRQSAIAPPGGLSGPINDPATLRRATLGNQANLQARGLSGAAPSFLQNMDPQMAALSELRGS